MAMTQTEVKTIGDDDLSPIAESNKQIKEELIKLKSIVVDLSTKLEQTIPRPCSVVPVPSVTPTILAGLDPAPAPVIAVVHEDPRKRPLRVPSQPSREPPWVPGASPLQLALQKAVDRDEDVGGFRMIFPVLEQRDAQGQVQRINQPIPFKQLKD